jgi:hypothetical protein
MPVSTIVTPMSAFRSVSGEWKVFFSCMPVIWMPRKIVGRFLHTPIAWQQVRVDCSSSTKLVSINVEMVTSFQRIRCSYPRSVLVRSRIASLTPKVLGMTARALLARFSLFSFRFLALPTLLARLSPLAAIATFRRPMLA